MDKKRKQIIIFVTSLIICAVAFGIILFFGKGRSFRSLKIFEMEGGCFVCRGDEEFEAFRDMNLRSGDVIVVPENSSMRILLDEDKYISMNEMSVIRLEADGTDKDSKTRVIIEAGEVTNEVVNKLSINSSYDIITPNTCMSIRGTKTDTAVCAGTDDESNMLLFDSVVGKLPLSEDSGLTAVLNENISKVGDEFDGTISVSQGVIEGKVVVSAVSVEYSADGTPVYRKVEFDIEQGQSVAASFTADQILSAEETADILAPMQTNIYTSEEDKINLVTVSPEEFSRIMPGLGKNDTVNSITALAETSAEDNASQPIPTAEPTATPEPKPTATPEPTPTATPEPTPVATPEPTPTATPEPTPTATPEPTPVLTVEPVPETPEEPTPVPTAEPTPEPLCANGHTHADGGTADAHSVCSVCGETLEGGSHHSYTSNVSKEATCTEEGEMTYSCTCGYCYTEAIPVAEHTPVSGGNADAHSVCSVCGEVLEDGTHHSYTDSITKGSTCTEEGEKTYSCTCGYSYTEPISVIEHTHANGGRADAHTVCSECGEVLEDGSHHVFSNSVTREATCSEEGIRTYTCSCGYTYTEPIAVREHTPVDGGTTYAHTVCSVCGEVLEGRSSHKFTGRVTKEATCTETGIMTYTCSCGYSYTETIPLKEHKSVDGGTAEAHKVCSECGAILEGTSRHTFTSEVTKDSTCTEEGIMTYTCSCGYSYTEPIRVKEHTPIDGKSEDAHKICSECGTVLEDGQHHSFTDEVTREATCTEEGIRTYTCSCGYSYTEPISIIPHTPSNGGTEDIHTVCSECGEVLQDGTHHHFIDSVTKEATCTEEGIRTYTCSCGYSYTEPISIIPHTPSNGGTADAHTVCGECGEVLQDGTHHSFTSKITKNATVDEEGIVTYTCSCGYSYTGSIPKIPYYVLGNTVSVNETNGSNMLMTVGMKSQAVSSLIHPAFTSSNTSVATVDRTTGVVTAIAPGQCTISSTLLGIEFTSVNVTVVNSFTLSTDTISMREGDLAEFPSVYLNSDIAEIYGSGWGISFTTNNSSVIKAEYNEEERKYYISSKKVGTATITFKDPYGFSRVCNVTVSSAVPGPPGPLPPP